MSRTQRPAARARLAAFAVTWILVIACGGQAADRPEFSIRKYADLPLAPTDSTIVLLGETYHPVTAALDTNTGVVVAAWQSATPDARGYSQREFYFNLLVQGVWGESPFTLDDVERVFSEPYDGDTTRQRPVLDEDGRPSYYRVLLREAPEDRSGNVTIMRTMELEGDVGNLALTRTFLGSPAEIETMRDQWLRDSGQVWFAALAGVRPAPTWRKLAHR